MNICKLAQQASKRGLLVRIQSAKEVFVVFIGNRGELG
jgi:hypothetical protein